MVHRLQSKIADHVYERLQQFKKAKNFSTDREALEWLILNAPIPYFRLEIDQTLLEWQKEICKHIESIDVHSDRIRCKRLNRYASTIDCQRCQFREVLK